jgi:hypothetical protein
MVKKHIGETVMEFRKEKAKSALIARATKEAGRRAGEG